MLFCNASLILGDFPNFLGGGGGGQKTQNYSNGSFTQPGTQVPKIWKITHKHIHTHNRFMAIWILSRTTRVSRHQKGKTSLDLLEQEIVSGSGISWAIYKSAPWPRHITMPTSHCSGFYRPNALLAPNQQHQSTQGNIKKCERNLYETLIIALCNCQEFIVLTLQKAEKYWQEGTKPAVEEL